MQKSTGWRVGDFVFELIALSSFNALTLLVDPDCKKTCLNPG